MFNYGRYVRFAHQLFAFYFNFSHHVFKINPKIGVFVKVLASVVI